MVLGRAIFICKSSFLLDLNRLFFCLIFHLIPQFSSPIYLKPKRKYSTLAVQSVNYNKSLVFIKNLYMYFKLKAYADKCAEDRCNLIDLEQRFRGRFVPT